MKSFLFECNENYQQNSILNSARTKCVKSAKTAEDMLMKSTLENPLEDLVIATSTPQLPGYSVWTVYTELEQIFYISSTEL